MFARAAIVGRVARERSEARRNFRQHKRELRKKTPQAPLRQRCFIPLLRGPWITVGTGILLIILGAVMCNFAFHAKEFSIVKPIQESNNASVSEQTTNPIKYKALKSLTFVGPSIMGLGIFIIIIACVLLMDKRDKVLKEYTESMLRTQQEISMELSYRAVTSTEMDKPPRNSSAKNNCAYSHFSEIRDTSSLGNRTFPGAASQSLPHIQSFHNAVKDLAEVQRRDKRDLELQTLHSAKSIDKDEALGMQEEADYELLGNGQSFGYQKQKLLPATSQV